uniref:Chromodomain Y-like protein n=1 Tax=Cacopsylla melanoneura TaxID=428564 RepID=A0A8D9AJ80_9HEMI
MAKRKGGKASGKAKATKNDIEEDAGSVDNEEYEVEKVIHHRKFTNGGVEYLIRWKGYGPDDDTWEKESNLTSSAVLIAEYKENNKVSSDEEELDEEKLDEEKTNGKENKSGDEDENDDDDPAPAKKKKSNPAAAKKEKKTSKSKGRGRPKGSTKDEAAKKKKSSAAKKKNKKDESSDDEGEETTEEYEVERIIEVHNGKHGKEYLVRWKGFTSKDDTWEPEEHLTCPDLIKQFNDKLGNIKSVTPKFLACCPAHFQPIECTPFGRAAANERATTTGRN